MTVFNINNFLLLSTVNKTMRSEGKENNCNSPESGNSPCQMTQKFKNFQKKTKVKVNFGTYAYFLLH